MAFVETTSSADSVSYQSIKLPESGSHLFPAVVPSPRESHSPSNSVVGSDINSSDTSDWLQRFEELCSWQKKQQETLLSQQQLQLEKLKKEQQLAAQRRMRHHQSTRTDSIDSKEVVGVGSEGPDGQVVEEQQTVSEEDRIDGEEAELVTERQEQTNVSVETDEEQDESIEHEHKEPSVNKDDRLFDERPLRPAFGEDTKTFTEFVEKQLSREQQASLQRSSLSMEKQPRTFLRKGQGLNRFNSKSLAVRQELDTPVVQTSEETKVNVQDVQDDTANSKLSERNLKVDDSFYVRTSYRQEVEQEELADFELMEKLADQSSFSSQCSLVRKVMTKGNRKQSEGSKSMPNTQVFQSDDVKQSTQTTDNSTDTEAEDVTEDETDESISSLSDVNSVDFEQQQRQGFMSGGQLSSRAVGVEFDDKETWEELLPQSDQNPKPITSTPPIKTVVSRQRKVYRLSTNGLHSLKGSEQVSDGAHSKPENHFENDKESDTVSHDGDNTLVSEQSCSEVESHGLVNNRTEYGKSGGSTLPHTVLSPPPTSALVNKLFPSLNGIQAQLKQNYPHSPVKTVRPVSIVRENGTSTDEVSAIAVKQKLLELEKEIERFKRENVAVAKLKEDREKALSELEKARVKFENWKKEEVSEFEAYKEEELRKIRQEKRVFEQYRMSVQNAPDRQERQQIATLKKENLELCGELERREARWAAANERYRSKISALERENSDLKQELKQLESASNGEKEEVKQANQKRPTQTAAKTRQSAQIEQNGRRKDQSKECTFASRKKGTVKTSSHPVQQNEQKMHVKSPNIVTRLTEQSKSVSFSDDNAASGEEDTSNKEKTGSMRSEVLGRKIEHSDGRVELVRADGSKTISYSNGTKKDVSADGLSVVLSFFNGDVKKITRDQKVVYYYAETKTQQTTYPDGLEVMEFSTGQVEKQYPDGTKEVIFPDQTVKYLFADGSQESVFTSGIIQRVTPSGEVTIEHPNGQREIHTRQFKRREYPDGTVKTVFTDGRQETRYACGRVRVKDGFGQLVVDTMNSDSPSQS
ncbi:centromere protein J-like isoform X3 [Corticium candelabrum]|uniref:centromere protein J-like isoform X3 n=1 Tax=Corticium candelabrum TaxID=121492 RepID=UPI002E261CA6|nr:centromere protein J-like isoform X3 [Corticium candelabrum]